MTIEIILPEGTTNLITNPSLEVDTTGYSAAGGSIVRSATYQYVGAYCLLISPGAGGNDGAYYTVSLTAGTNYTFSVFFKGRTGVRYRIYFADDTTGAILGTSTDFTGDDEWHRYEVTYPVLATTTYRLVVGKAGSSSTFAFYTDGWQLEVNNYATSYCDGDQQDCVWNGLPHTSTSTRDAQARSGGRVIDLDDYDIAISELFGFGLPPVQNNALPLAGQPGSLLQSVKVLPRVIQLVCITETDTEAGMYSALAQLQAAIWHEAYSPLQPVRVRYTRNTKTIYLDCYYDGGMEGSFQWYTNTKFTLRLIAYDPYWRAEQEAGAVLDTLDTLNMGSVVAWRDGEWDRLSMTTNGGVQALAVGADGKVYVGGSFTNLNGDADQDRIAVYDPVTGIWSDLGTGGADGTVSALVAAPDGSIYAAGSFANIGGVAATRIARWNGSSWAALGTGLNNTVWSLAIAPDGTLYAGGQFTTAGGTNAPGIAQWDGSTWAALTGGATATNGAVLGIAFDDTGVLYACGDFTTIEDTALNYIAQWDGSSWTAVGTASGCDDAVWWVFWNTYDKRLYACGEFTTIGGISATKAARWNGSQWENVADPSFTATGRIYYWLADHEGMIWAVGDSTAFGGVSPINPGVIRFDGYSWLTVPIAPTATVGEALAVSPNGDVYVGYNYNGAFTTEKFPGTTTATNEGSAPAYPIIKIKRSGGTSATLVYIRNQTTGDELFFDIDLLDGETITLDFSRPDKQISSDYRGSGSLNYQPGSKVNSFRLLPGDNDIQCLIDTAGSPTISATMTWQLVYASAEAAS